MSETEPRLFGALAGTVRPAEGTDLTQPTGEVWSADTDRSHDRRTDDYASRSYGDTPVGFGRKPGIVVVDFQTGFTDPKYPLGGAPLIIRAVENTHRLLDAARRCGVPIATCNTAYLNEREMPHWKISAVRETFIHGMPGTEIDPAVYDPDYDFAVTKSGPSIFFQTPVVPYFVKEGVDTVIVTGCTTSGCIRATAIESFSWRFRTIVPEDCVGDHEEGPHRDNLRDIGRRYVDISTADACLAHLDRWRMRNAA
jgi:maleamate amidohydrolase